MDASIKANAWSWLNESAAGLDFIFYEETEEAISEKRTKHIRRLDEGIGG